MNDLTAREFYRKRNDEDSIPEHDGIPVFTPDDMIWFAEAYHKAKQHQPTKEVEELIDRAGSKPLK